MAEMRPNAFPQPKLEPEPQLSAPVQPQQRPSTSAAPSPSSRLPEQLMYKNRLQEYAQKSAIQLPMYKTVNEGSQHAPKFRSTVVVDGQIYTSSNTFLQRKIAEQDVSKLALEHISKKIKDEICPLTTLICENTVFCKSILNEFAVKMNLQKPIYNTVQREGLPPVFISSLVFNGVCYNGEPGRNKKEAEQLAARVVILSHLGESGSGIILSEIIKSKGKLYAALHKVKDRSHANISAVPQGPSIRAMEVAIPGASSSQAVNLQSGFVPVDLPEPLIVGPSSSKKRQKSQEEADKKLQYDTQRVLDIIEAGRLSLAALPMTQAPPSSLA